MANGGRNQGGYDAIFYPELDRKYICPICLAALHEPMQTSCGHRFCKNCILGVINGRSYGKCPVDNAVFKYGDELFEDKAFRREVLSQTVKCRNHEEGCSWIGELRSLEEHEIGCLFSRTECINSCGITVTRNMLSDHLNVCERRLVQCQHCQSQIPFSDMTKHQVLVCQNLPVQCTLCGQTGICRKDISSHIDITNGDCHMTIVPCQYASFGCQFQDKRRNMVDHYTEAANHHILLLVRKISDQDKRISMLENDLASTRQDQAARNEVLDRRGILLECVKNHFCSGTIKWKIPITSRDITAKKFVSESFYTGCPGYKVFASLEIVGFREGSESYSSLFLIFERGLFDENQELTFPHSKIAHVTVFDQSENASLRADYHTSLPCVDILRQRNETSTSGRRGLLKFMKTNELLSKKYTNGGFLHFKISIDDLSINLAGLESP